MCCLGCKQVSDMPRERPLDLVVRLSEGGGMLPESESYLITTDSVVRNSFYQFQENHWVCKPDAGMLDALWNALLRVDATTIRSRDEGQVYDRGGTTVHIEYGGKDVVLTDAGNLFVLEVDRIRFSRMCGAIFACVANCMDAQTVDTQVVLDVETGDRLPETCHISMNGEAVVDWPSAQAQALAQTAVKPLLPGHYLLDASAKFGARYLSLRDTVEISAANRLFHIVLKSDTFALVAQ